MAQQTTLTSPPLIIGQDYLVDSSTQYQSLGAYAETADGRGFRYALIGGVSTVAGQLYQSAAENTSNERNLAVTAAAIGATQVVTTTTITTTANQYDQGYLYATVTPGAGYTYKIRNHTVVSSAAATFNLQDPLIVAYNTTSRVGVFPHPYAKVVVSPTTGTGMPVGVAAGIITNANYGWLQTHGPCSCLAQGTITVIDSLIAANSTNAGSVAVATNGVSAPIGYALSTGTSTEYPLVFLTID